MPDNNPSLQSSPAATPRCGDGETRQASLDNNSEVRATSAADVAVVVLAAGHGKRMHSEHPKHLHPVAGIAIVERVIRAAIGAGTSRTLVMVGSNLPDLGERLDLPGACSVIVQGPPRGTADSVRQALEHAGDVSWLVSLLGDSPLLTADIVEALLQRARSSRSKVTLLTCIVDDASAYGRIHRDEQGRVRRIVELKNDEPDARRGPTEINSGVMVLDAVWARAELAHLPEDPTTGEFLLTDLVDVAVREASADERPWPVDSYVADAEVSLGVNDRVDLAKVDAIARSRIRERHMRAGVTIIGPETVFIDEDVQIGRDTMVHPHSILLGSTTIGRNCVIGPSTVLDNANLDDEVTIEQSTVRRSSIGTGTHVGPYAHVRGGCQIGVGVHIGSYAELKNATLADGVKCGHVSYLGDVDVGANANIGAGTITANYDGTQKHVTAIGENVFIGSDSVLVAPVRIGDRARTGAGSVVNRDVEPDSTVVGVPARAIGDRAGRRRSDS